MSHPNPVNKHDHRSAGGLERLGAFLADAHPDLIISKRRMRKVESIECVRLKRDVARQNLGFSSRPFVLCGLPIRMPAPGSLLHERRNGQFVLQVTGHPSYGLPWGQDRLVPIFLATLAIRQQTPRITFDSAAEMLDTFGMQQSAREQRRMVGGRYFNRLPGEPPRPGFDYNVETGFQWGTFGNRQIRTWGAGGNFGWTLPGSVWPVRFGLQADAISGDNGQPGTLGTLNAFFPRGAYFGPKFALIGPANLLSAQPQFVFHPLPNVTGTFEWIWFWRESTKDALYTFGNVPIRPANLSSARFVGSQPNLEFRWAIREHVLAALNLAGFVTGEFLKQSPPSNAIVFFNLGLTYRF